MKVSKYNVLVPVEDNKKILYNTISRKYISYNNCNEKLLMDLMKNLNKGKYSVEELKYIKELISKGIIIRNDIDEIDKIKFQQGKVGFQAQCFFAVVLPILDNNFKLTYCWEENRKIHIKQGSEEEIIKFIDEISKKALNIEICWFGKKAVFKFDKTLEINEKLEEICEKNNCEYRVSITVSGKLLANEIVEKLLELDLYKIQIVVKSIKYSHSSNIFSKNKYEIYEKIKNNILMLSNSDILINLRINVDEENYDHIIELFDIVPKQNRHKINVHFCNIVNNSKKVNLFNVYKAVIDKGYKYFDIKNEYSICELCIKSGLKIQSSSRIASCFVNEQSKKCRECVQFPMYMWEWRDTEHIYDDLNNRKRIDGLSLDEKIKLHYYSDIM